MADRHKSPPLSIRPTDEQRAEIVRRAERAGMSVNRYLLTAALSGSDVAPSRPPRRAPALDGATLALLRGLLGQVGQLGNNVNQLARTANLGRLANGAECGPALLAEVRALSAAIQAAMSGRKPERHE